MILSQKNANTNLLGIAAALVAWLCFSLNDVGVKLLSGDYPLHQIILVRSAVGMLLTLIIIMPLEGGWSNMRTKHPLLHLVRGLCVVIANMSFFIGLATLTLPEATTLFFAAPLFITVFSVLFLGEVVGRWRWFAVALGMAGVIVVMRPGSASFKYASLLPLFAAVAYAMLQILTRKIGFRDKASTMSFYIQVVFVVVSIIFGLAAGDGRFANPDNPTLYFLLRAWVWPSSDDLAIMMGLGVASAAGGYGISQAYRISEAAVIAPFEYLALIYSIFWSVVIWNIWPDLYGWMGVVLIFIAGMTVFWREVVKDKKLVIKHPLPRNR